ncbi:LysR family transcriptional regulator [Belnapia sp. T6]|uniref:LysR family transcriptional regulator n=1 Tax=Belnapia mucosa TaxID=2804532 RepID=A0ABS1V2Y1_9PROT|nr:LysR substrate-binding domain-containing protein [Belnapia mucosa]MBL6455481.1 LysR family transcriptional regulator [Belnapia mucosa]
MTALPSLRALRAFAEVAAAGGRIAPAARRLGVTPSAVSHLLRELERSLGAPLLAGRGAPEPLTEAGKRLAGGLAGGFAAIEAAVAEARRRRDPGEVRVSALTTFATLWLVPRLPRFRAARPATQLLLATDTRPVDLTTEPFDCAIRYGLGPWPGLDCRLLFRERMVVVANPRLLATAPLARLPRIGARSRREDWPMMLPALGLPEAPIAAEFPNRGLAVQAALAGLGATVVDRVLVGDLLAAGLLAEAAPGRWVERAEGHHVVATPVALQNPHLRALRDWLLAEVAPQRNCAPASTSMVVPER